MVRISGDGTSPALAALANAAAVFHMELDDVHRTSHTHPAVTTVPTVLAVAEAGWRGGRGVIEAIVAGYEAQTRVGRALSPSIYLALCFRP
jgi:2-methylcitrate dehydratase PrpD